MKQTPSPRPESRSFLVAWLPLAVLLAIALVSGLGAPRGFADNFAVAARRSLLDPALYTADRPPGIYLLYKLCAYAPERIVLVQALLSALAFALLGWSLARDLRSPWTRALALTIVPLGALAWNVAGWNALLLTESLTFSQFALVYACLAQYLRRGGWPETAALLALVALTGFTRDQNSYAMLLLILLAVGLRGAEAWRARPERRRTLGLVIAVLALAALQTHLASLGRRHVFSLYNVLFQRILPQDEHVRWFVAHGAPLQLVAEDSSRTWRGQWASSHDWAVYREPRYAPLHQWNRDAGKADFARFLASHPRYLVMLPWTDREQLFSAALADYTGPPRTEPWYLVAGWCWSWPLLWLGLPTMLLYALMAWRGGVTAAPLVLALTVLAGGLLAYHADAMEVPRHCITTAFGLRCAILHVVLLAADRLSSRPLTTLQPSQVQAPSS